MSVNAAGLPPLSVTMTLSSPAEAPVVYSRELGSTTPVSVGLPDPCALKDQEYGGVPPIAVNVTLLPMPTAMGERGTRVRPVAKVCTVTFASALLPAESVTRMTTEPAVTGAVYSPVSASRVPPMGGTIEKV